MRAKDDDNNNHYIKLSYVNIKNLYKHPIAINLIAHKHVSVCKYILFFVDCHLS